MGEPSIPPSAFLPSLHPPPALATLGPLLARLSCLFAPQNIFIDLRASELDDETVWKQEPEEDEFEVSFVRGWLGRVVSLGAKELGRGGDEEWGVLVDQAAILLAVLSGHCAAGSRTKTFLLPASLPPFQLPLSDSHHDLPLPTPPPSRPPSTSPIHHPSPDLPLVLAIRDTTLLASSTGFRTWGSAPLLARLIASSPSDFFPSPSPSSTPPVRTLELGSGTGLVGLTAAAVLHRLEVPATIDLSDFEDAVLENLAHNLALNVSQLGTASIGIKRLDWTEFYDTREDPVLDWGRTYDTIFGADLIYEPQHPESIHATVSALLRFPDASFPSPTFHLVLPLRSTHAAEHNAFDAAFSSDGPGEARFTMDEEGRKWRLVTTDRRDATGEDGFGGGRKRGEAQVAWYWVYRIGWQRVD